MIRNLGGKLKGKKKDIPSAVNKRMELDHALFLGPLPENDPDSGIESDEVKLGGLSNGKYWDLASAGKKGVFDPGTMNLPDQETGMVYFSFWMYSPRSLTDLLIEPDMPRMDMHVESAGALSLQVNGKALSTDNFEGLPLEKGWNHILLRLMPRNVDWSARVWFSSPDTEFLKEIKTTIDRYVLPADDNKTK